ncbi:MAG TPA: bifunctional phosphoribosylaminoimidazolecarboxamide formyltransferase/IMP cyclohydrolase, partial [Longimicrobiaceae bacterium]|nr:bifunctional phosphoribosylaminoimidazolecarboxamide formyltransferase/IMP cyclohydrolase [Longimicrobiaceae bacterium]
MPRALLSVSDKTGLIDFARTLQERGWTLLSTGGTARTLREAGVQTTEVSEVTGHPEIMEGRVKTLHPAVHAALLGRRGHPGDRAAMEALGYVPIDLLAVNLYPFRETIARPDATDAEAIEQIDIGGPAMLRSAAKNHENVWVVVDPRDYVRVTTSLEETGESVAGLRRELAAKVFAHTSAYDAAIGAYLEGEESGGEAALPDRIEIDLRRVQSLRYGENPDQAAAFYADEKGRGGLPALR